MTLTMLTKGATLGWCCLSEVAWTGCSSTRVLLLRPEMSSSVMDLLSRGSHGTYATNDHSTAFNCDNNMPEKYNKNKDLITMCVPGRHREPFHGGANAVLVGIP